MKKMSTGFRAELFFAGFLIVAGYASAVIVDSNPAPFRGQKNTTLQAWDFLTHANPATPESVWINPFGTPSTEITGPSKDSWLIEDHGHQGVWEVDAMLRTEMRSIIPNVPEPGSSTDVWVQVVYFSDNFPPTYFQAPKLYVIPDGDFNSYQGMIVMENNPLDDVFFYSRYHVTIQPGFKFCIVYVRPADCDVNIDSLLIETLAVGVFSPDIDGAGSVNLPDLILLAEQWTRSDCSGLPENKWCSDADLNQDGAVNLDDLAILSAYWLTE